MVWDAWPSTLTATVTNPPAVDDFAVKVIVAYQTGMRSDFADLRFSKDGVALSHTIWAYSAGVSAEVWVKIPSGTTAFTLHYGNASASDASDPDETFLFCDRFTGYFSDHWEHIYRGQSDSSAVMNANDELLIIPPSDKTPGSMRGLVSKTTFSKGIVVEYNDKLTGNTFYPGITIGTGNIVDYMGGSTRWDQCAHETGYSVVTTNTQYPNDGTYLQRNLSGGAGVLDTDGPGYAALGTYSIKRFIWAANNYLAFENSGTVVVSGTDSTWQNLTGAKLVIYQGWYGGNGGTRVMDWIRVRPYQATEPTVVLSAGPTYEELAGTIEAVSDTSSDLEIPTAPSGTLTLYPVDDSYHEHRVNNSSLATLRSAAGNGGARLNTSQWACDLETASDTTTNNFLVLIRSIISFDTSEIPENATILSATLKLTRSGGNNLLGNFSTCLVGATPADPTYHNVTASDNDYSNVGSTELADRVAYGDWDYLAQHTFDLNESGLAAIVKGGYTSFGLRISWDLDGSFTGTWGAGKWSETMIYSREDGTESNRPVLEISYKVGETHEMEGAIAATTGASGASTRIRTSSGVILATAIVQSPQVKATVSVAATVVGTAGVPAAQVQRLRGLTGTVAATGTCQNASLTRLKGISGAAGAVSVSAGFLQALLDLYGAAISVQAGLSGLVTRLRQITGSVAVQATATANLKAPVSLSGTTAGTSVYSSALLRATIGIDGSVTASSSVISTLRAFTALNGSSSPVSGIQGSLQAVLEITGTNAAISGATGTLQVTFGLQGTLPGTSTVAGGFGAVVPCAGVSLAAVTGATGTVIRLRGVAGRVETVGAATGHLEAINQITGTIHAVSSGIGNLHAPVPLTGEIHEVSGAAGIVYSGRVAVLVPGTSAGTGVTVASPITRLRSLIGSAPGTGVLSGALQATNLISGAIPCTASISGLLKATLPVTALTVSATSSCSGQIQVIANLYGAIPANAATLESLLRAITPLTGTTLPAQASLAVSLQVEARLSGTCDGQATTQINEWTRLRGVSATVPGKATVGGALKAPTPIEGSLPASASTSASVTRVRTLSGAIAVTSGTNGSVAAPVPLSGTVAPSPGVSGALQATVLIAGTVAINSGASVTATRLRSVVGGVAADSGCTGVCVAYVALGATVAAVGEGSAPLAAPVPLQVAVPVSSGLECSVTRMRSLSVSVPVVSGGTGTFFTQVDIIGTVSGTGSVAGTLQVEAVQVIANLSGAVPAISGGSATLTEAWAVFWWASAASTRATLVPNVATAPDGTQTADLLQETTASGTHYATCEKVLPAGNYIFSVYVKPAGREEVMADIYGLDWSQYIGSAWFYLWALGAYGWGTKYTEEMIGDGWKKCSIGWAHPGSGAAIDFILEISEVANYTGDGSSGVYLWGAQIEPGILVTAQVIPVSGDTSATSLLSASLNAVISLNGALNTEGKVTGLITYVASLTGLVLETSGVIGDLAGPKPLYGAINSGSSINGEISAARSVNGTVSCESSVGGNLTAIVPLNIECTVTGGLNGVLAVPQVEHLTGAFPVTGSCAGSIVVTVRLETAIASVSEIFGDLKSGVAFSSEVTPVSSVTGELSLGKAVELVGLISAVSINSGIANTRRSLTCEGAAASTTVSVWLSRAIPITCVVLEASWGQANINHSASLSGTIAAYSGIQGSLGVRSIRAATSCMEACVASTTREAICVRETVGYAVPITAKVSYTFSFTVTSSTRKIVAKTVYRVVSTQYKEEYRVFALPDDLNVGEEVLDCYVVVTKSEFCVVGL